MHKIPNQVTSAGCLGWSSVEINGTEEIETMAMQHHPRRTEDDGS
jgi:hypothetical protein